MSEQLIFFNTKKSLSILILLMIPVYLFAFDPGTGPGNINATNEVAYVSQTYTFSDGCYARGMVYFQNGFTIQPNSRVTLGVIPPFQPPVSFDVTSTVLLEQPLRFGYPTFGTYNLAGTFKAATASDACIIISEAPVILVSSYAFFPGNTTLDLGGGYFSMSSGSAIFIGDSSSPTTYNLTLKNAVLVASPASQPMHNAYIAPNSTNGIFFQDCAIDIYNSVIFNDLILRFLGNCSINNGGQYGNPPYTKETGEANFIMDCSTSGMTSYIGLGGGALLQVGPDVNLQIGNLGKRYPPYYLGGSIIPGVYGYGSNSQMLMVDSTLTLSRPCTVEGGGRLIIGGNCDFYSTATDARDRILTLGNTYLQVYSVNADLEIQQSSVLNLHNMILSNNNNP